MGEIKGLSNSIVCLTVDGEEWKKEGKVLWLKTLYSCQPVQAALRDHIVYIFFSLISTWFLVGQK